MESTEKDREEMSLQKQHKIGIDPETGEPLYVHESPFKVKYGYMPPDAGFKDEIYKMGGDISTSKKNIQLLEQQIPLAKESLPFIESQIEMVENRPDIEMWQVDLNMDGVYSPDEQLSRSDLLAKLREEKSIRQEIIGMESKLPSYKKQISDSEATQEILMGYERLGYVLGREGDKYTIDLPTHTEVHKWWAGSEDVHKTSLAMASFLKSPLGIGTVAQATWAGITGDKKVWSAYEEEVSAYSLGLQDALRHGEYAPAVLSSPALIEGVYLPVATMGLGYGTTGLTTRATSNVAQTVFRGHPIAKAFASTAVRGATVVAGGVGLGLTAYSLTQTQTDFPELMPSRIAETAFTFGLAYGSYRHGSKLWKQRHLQPPSPDKYSISDMIEHGYGDKKIFSGELRGKVQGLEYHGDVHGIQTPIKGTDKAVSKAVGKWTSEWVYKGFTRYKTTQFFRHVGVSEQVGKMGKLRLFESDALSRTFSGVSSHGTGKTVMMDFGKPKFDWIDVGFTPEQLPSISKFIYSGKYTSSTISGREFGLGRVMSFVRGAGKGGTSTSSSGVKIQYGDIVSQSLTKLGGTNILSAQGKTFTTQAGGLTFNFFSGFVTTGGGGTQSLLIKNLMSADIAQASLNAQKTQTLQILQPSSAQIPASATGTQPISLSVQGIMPVLSQDIRPRQITIPDVTPKSININKTIPVNINVPIDTVITETMGKTKPINIKLPVSGEIYTDLNIQGISPVMAQDIANLQSQGLMTATTLVPVVPTITLPVTDFVPTPPPPTPILPPFLPLLGADFPRGRGGVGYGGMFRKGYRYREFYIPKLKELLGGEL